MQSLSGSAAALQNKDDPHCRQNPYSTVGSGEYQLNVPAVGNDTCEGCAAVAAMW
jgi:hypothetical protein